MNGVHDMGGMDGFGKVEPEENEPVFHARWEGRLMAMNRAMGALRHWSIDVGRYGIEVLPPDVYLSSSYYRRWYFRTANLAVQRGLIGELIGRFERRGLKLVGMKFMQVSEALARQHYAVHAQRPFFNSLIKYIVSAPVVAMVVEGTNAIAAVRNTVGATKPAEAAPGTIRADFGLEIGRNLVHASDGPETAASESTFMKMHLPRSIHRPYRATMPRRGFPTEGALNHSPPTAQKSPVLGSPHTACRSP